MAAELCGTPFRKADGLSSAATILSRQSRAMNERDQTSIVLGGRISELTSALGNVGAQASKPDWDGEDGDPITNETLELALTLLIGMPADIPMPDLSPESDGGVNMEWHRGYRRVFSVSVKAGQKLPFAWLNGTSRMHGVANFNGGSAPDVIVDAIRRIIRK